MLQLPELKIGVDTKELETVVTTLNNIKTAVDNIGKSSANINVKVKETKTKIVEVGEAASEASKKLEDAGNAGQVASKGIEATAEASKKAKKALEEVGDGGNNATDGLSNVERKLQQTALKMQYLRGESITLKDGIVELGKGFTSSQSNQLAVQQMLGATAEQIKELAALFRQFNDVTGANKFDDSISGFIKMQKEVKELKNASALLNEGLGLTREEIKFLARDIESTTQSFQKEGRSATELGSAIQKLKQDYSELSKERHAAVAEARAIEDAVKQKAKLEVDSKNTEANLERINAEIQRVKRSAEGLNDALKLSTSNKLSSFESTISKSGLAPEIQAAKIQEYRLAISQLAEAEKQAANLRNQDKSLQKVEAEMLRAQNALAGFNEEMKVSNSNRLTTFEANLKKSGLAVEEQTKRLNAYRDVINKTQAAEAERGRKQLADNTAYIQRAVAPQMTDIFVGLATGQSPLTIMLQQGGQLSDQFRMAGIEANQMGEIMRKSIYGILPLYLEVGRAIGTTVVGAFVDAGKAVLTYAGALAGVEAIQYRVNALMLANKGTRLEGFFTALNGAVSALAGTMTAFAATSVAVLAAGLVALGVGFVSIIKEENELIRVTNLTGASLGLTKDTAIGFANAMKTVSGTTTDTIKVISEMAKVGGFTKDQIEIVRNTAVAMSEATGQAFDKTVKAFSDFSKKPTEELIKFAKETGLVKVEVLALVAELEREGKRSEAAAVAMKAYGEASVATATKIKTEYGALTRLGISLGNLWDKVWDRILGVGRTESAADTVKRTAEQLAANEKLNRPLVVDSLRREQSAANRTMLLQSEANIQKQLLSQAAEAQSEFEEYYKKHKSNLDDLEKENLSRQAFINKEKEKLDRRRNNGAIISAKQYNDIIESVGKEWDNAHKQKKDPTENFFETSLNSLKNESNQAAKELENLTQSQKKFLDITNDPKFAKLTANQKIQLAKEVEISSANELRARSATALTNSLKELEAVERKSATTLEDYSESQKAMLKIFDSKAFTEMTDAAKQEVVAKFELIYANEQLATSEKKRQELLKDYLSDLDKAQDFSRNYTKRVKEIDEAYVEGIITLKEYTEQLNALGRTQKGVINANKAIEEHKKLMAGLNAEIQALEDQADAYDKTSVSKKRYLEETKARKKYAEELSGAGDNEKRQAEALERFQARMKVAALRAENEITSQWTAGIGDAITTAIFEGGSAGGKKLRSFLVAELRKQISLQINVLIQPFVQGFTQALGLTGGGTQGGSVGNFLTNGISGAIQSGFTKLANSNFGQKLGLSEEVAGPPTADGTVPTAMTELGSTLSKTAGVLGSVATGLALNKAISGGYSVSKGMDSFQKLGVAVGSFFGLGEIIGAATGLFNRMFGRKLKDTGIQGTFDTKGFDGQSYQFYKGGLFRSDKTVTSELDKKTESDFALQFQGIKQSVGGLVSALGLTAPSIDTFTKSIKLSFNGLTDEQIKQKITDTFTEITDDLVREAFTTKSETTKVIKETQAVTEGWGEDQVTTYKDVEKSITDTTYTMREDIPQWVKTILEAKGYTKEALDIITEMPDKILASLGTSSQELSSIIVLGMQEGDPEGAGKSFADAITFGIKNALQQSFAQQITGIVTTQLVTPIVTALTTGATVTQAIATVSIDTMKTQLQNTIAAFTSIFTNPEISKLLDDINNLISKTVEGSIPKDIKFDSPPQSYQDIVAERKKAAEDAAKADKDSANKAKDIAEERLSLEKKLLELKGNTVELRRLELEKIDPSNQELQKRIWLLEDEKKILDERKGLEQELYSLQENTLELRRIELEKLDPSNRELQSRIWLLEDEKKAIEKQKEVLADYVSTLDNVADKIMLPEDARKYKYNRVAEGLTEAGYVGVSGDMLSKLSITEIRRVANEIANMSDVSIQARTAVLNAADSLLELNDNFDEIADNAEYLKKTAEGNTDKAFSALQKAIEKQKELADKSKETLNTSIDDMKSIFDYLKEQIKELLTEVEPTAKNLAAKGKLLIQEAITSGVLPKQKDLEDAVSAIRTDIEKTKYVTKFDQERAKLLLAIDLEKLQGITKDQLTDAQKQLEATEKQIKQYDDMLQKYQDQIDIMRGNYVATLSVADAVNALNTALTGEVRTAQQIASNAVIGESGAVFNQRTGEGRTASGMYFNADQLRKDAITHLTNGGSWDAIYNAIASSGFDVAQIEGIVGSPIGSLGAEAAKVGWSTSSNASNYSLDQFAESYGIGGFDVGTNYVPSDRLAVIHKGEAVVPKAFNPSVFNNSDDSDSEDMQNLRAEVRAVVNHVSKLSRNIDRLIVPTTSGDALQTKAVV